jgi:hypothetical protein
MSSVGTHALAHLGTAMLYALHVTLDAHTPPTPAPRPSHPPSISRSRRAARQPSRGRRRPRPRRQPTPPASPRNRTWRGRSSRRGSRWRQPRWRSPRRALGAPRKRLADGPMAGKGPVMVVGGTRPEAIKLATCMSPYSLSAHEKYIYE